MLENCKRRKKAVVCNITGSKLHLFEADDMHKTQFCNLKFQPADMSPG
ncbi:hypothetical protein RchiOBHm_Chr7g0217251 [Rosa chinensis]|uniref:Uncharacterized protein n=1 Tax=Rosa chinensis TaxID=74649 RepID=A0A2P6PBY6_ROSCH|nr:hypothetical protein RchiOBHm_Chr7g0217251 [Rosa chinensis]